MKALAIAFVVAATAAWLVAGYLFSFCVPLESACHMGGTDACEALAHTMRTSKCVAASGIALALGALLTWRRMLAVIEKKRRLG